MVQPWMGAILLPLLLLLNIFIDASRRLFLYARIKYVSINTEVMARVGGLGVMVVGAWYIDAVTQRNNIYI